MEKGKETPADNTRQRQIQRLVAEVIALLPLLRAGQPNPQFDGKSWRQWSADRLRDRAAAFYPRQPRRQVLQPMPPRPNAGALYEPTPPWHRGPGGAVYRGD